MGAHFNPAVSIADAMQGGLPWLEVPAYAASQIVGAIAGVIAANIMSGLPAISLSTRMRSGPAQLFNEFFATFGLMTVIWGSVRYRSDFVA